jgi:streptomycin 6-kinase
MRGSAGAAWLDSLADRISAIEQQWHLRAGGPAAQLRFNYVAHAQLADGRPAILKLSIPTEREFLTEARALQHFDGHGCARLLDVDFEAGAMLIEGLQPGTPLDAYGTEAERIRVTAEVMRALWRPTPAEHYFPTVAYWCSGFKRLLRDRYGGTSGPLPEPLVSRAEALSADLVASQTEHVLLHGDLHWFNILAAEREPWLAIDPKGVIGEPAYEVGDLLRNRIPSDDASAALSRRIDQLAEILGFNPQRLRAWGFVQAILSAVWSLDDGHPSPDWALRAAEALLPVQGP